MGLEVGSKRGLGFKTSRCGMWRNEAT